MARYESGVHQPGLEVLSQLAVALNVPSAFLVTEDDQLAQAILYLSRLMKDDPQRLGALLAEWES